MDNQVLITENPWFCGFLLHFDSLTASLCTVPQIRKEAADTENAVLIQHAPASVIKLIQSCSYVSESVFRNNQAQNPAA